MRHPGDAWNQAQNLEARQHEENAMHTDPLALDAIFGEQIHRCARAQTLHDRLLLHVTPMVCAFTSVD